MGYSNVVYDSGLPWAQSEEDIKFKKLVKKLLIIFSILILIFVLLPVIQTEKEEQKELPKRFAKLVIKKDKPAAPPKAKAQQKKQKTAQKKKSEKKKVKKTPKKKPDSKRLENTALMAMRDELADLRESFDVSKVKTAKRTNATKSNRRAASSVITSNATQGSGGIDTRSLDRSTGGGNLSGREASGVSSGIGGTGGVGRRVVGGKAGRSQEEIERVFQRNKGSINTLYNRALRRDPSLQGKVVLELTITPSGKVTKCRVISSELNNKKLERKLVARVLLFRFSKKDVATVTVTYPIDFLPS